MTTIEKVNKATDILNAEGYRVNHRMSVFGLFPNENIEQDVIKSFVRLDAKCIYSYSPDEIKISFRLWIKKIDGDICSTDENRMLAHYINHVCDVVDQLNDLQIVLKRDLSELNLT